MVHYPISIRILFAFRFQLYWFFHGKISAIDIWLFFDPVSSSVTQNQFPMCRKLTPTLNGISPKNGWVDMFIYTAGSLRLHYLCLRSSTAI